MLPLIMEFKMISELKKPIYLCLCVVVALSFYAVPANAEIEEELSFEMSEAFSAVEASQDLAAPSIPKQRRLKFYDSDDGDWSAGLGVALIEPQAGDLTDNDISPTPAPFLNIQFKLGHE